MKPLGIALGLILLSGSTATFGQSIEPLQAVDRLKAELAQLAQVQTPYSFQLQGPKTEPTAALQTGLQGAWWREARWVQTLDLTADQQKKMDDAFRQNRIKLIDLTATLEKAELMLEPLVENPRPGDESQILAQIDGVANARAELEKANARMLLAIRQVLTQDQWNKLPKTNAAFRFNYLSNGKVRAAPVPPAAPAPPAPPVGTK